MFEEIDVDEEDMYGKLCIYIKDARGLPNGNVLGPRNCFVKLNLLPMRPFGETVKVSNDLNPVWDEVIELEDVSFEKLSTFLSLELMVIDETESGGHHIIGGLRLGPEKNENFDYGWLDSNLLELSHWDDMLAHPGEWMECCHALRPSREYLDLVTYKPSILYELSTTDDIKAVSNYCFYK